jgi:hypothetical protein
MGIGDVLTTVGRVGVGIATGGASEVALAGYNALKPDDLQTPQSLRAGNLNLGATAQMVPNPAWDTWNARAQTLRGGVAAVQLSDPSKANALQQKLNAHLATEPPREIPNPLLAGVRQANEQGAAAAANIGAANAALQQTGAQANAQGQVVNAGAQQQAAAAGTRAAPQMTEAGRTQAQQQVAINNINTFRPSTAGQEQLLGYTPSTVGQQELLGFNPNTQQSAALRGYQASTAGVSALNQFANGPTGPSAAEAMLRLQSARDKAAALSRARGARGGAGAVNEALKVAQAEGSAIAADTRGQLSVVQAQEAAMRRQEQLQALTSSASALGDIDRTNLSAQTAAGQLDAQADQTRVQAITGAANIGAQADQTRVQALNAGTQAGLQGSEQELRARTAVVEATSRVRDQDIAVLRDNLSAEMQTMDLNDNQVRFFTGLGEAARQAGVQAQMTAQAQGIDANVAIAQAQATFTELAWRMLTAEQQAQIQAMGIEAGVDMANAQQRSAFTGQLLGFAGSGLGALGAAMSDRRTKTDIKRVKSMAAALRGTPGHEWRYKDEKHGKGRFVGAMAQDLEKHPEFRSAVKKRADGFKEVDATWLVMSHHAALSDLQHQIDRMNKLKKAG